MGYDEARGYITSVCKALCQLHSQRIAHFGLCSSKVLIAQEPDGSERIKVTDLGLAWDFSNSTATNKTCIDTPWHRPPEAGGWLRDNVDTWTVALLLLELRLAQKPFSGLIAQEGLTEEERQRRRCPGELDNPDSEYYERLRPLEKVVVRDCLRPLSSRPPLRQLVNAHREYFGLIAGP